MIFGDICQICCHFRNLLGDWYLGDWRGVLSNKSLDQSFDGKNIFSLYLLYGTFFLSQMSGLEDVHECIHDGLNSDMIAGKVRPNSHPGCEFYEDDLFFTWIDLLYLGICPAYGTVTPSATPILFPSPGSFCSDSIINYFPHKHCITCDATFFGIRYSFHDLFLGIRKLELKIVLYFTMLLKIRYTWDLFQPKMSCSLSFYGM